MDIKKKFKITSFVLFLFCISFLVEAKKPKHHNKNNSSANSFNFKKQQKFEKNKERYIECGDNLYEKATSMCFSCQVEYTNAAIEFKNAIQINEEVINKYKNSVNSSNQSMLDYSKSSSETLEKDKIIQEDIDILNKLCEIAIKNEEERRKCFEALAICNKKLQIARQRLISARIKYEDSIKYFYDERPLSPKKSKINIGVYDEQF